MGTSHRMNPKYSKKEIKGTKTCPQRLLKTLMCSTRPEVQQLQGSGNTSLGTPHPASWKPQQQLPAEPTVHGAWQPQDKGELNQNWFYHWLRLNRTWSPSYEISSFQSHWGHLSQVWGCLTEPTLTVLSDRLETLRVTQHAWNKLLIWWLSGLKQMLQ